MNPNSPPIFAGTLDKLVFFQLADANARLVGDANARLAPPGASGRNKNTARMNPRSASAAG